MNLVEFLNNSPSSYNAIDSIKKILDENHYVELDERDAYALDKGGKYYIIRNGSSVMAFNVGNNLENPSLQLTASHSDCPSFVLKPNCCSYEGGYFKLNTEVYGGVTFYSWLDRPLSIAGRIIYREDGSVKSCSYKYDKPFCLIPSVAIHMNREVNTNLNLNPQVDMLPMVSLEKGDILSFLKEDSGKDVLSYDLFLYPVNSAYLWGKNDEFITGNHLDDLQCAYNCLMGFIDSFNDNNINIYCCFDNEEIGSSTRQGADSDFLFTNLNRICNSLNIDYYRLLARGFMLSCDNAHALHPNHNEKHDALNRPSMNKGIVIKHETRAYTSDGLSIGYLKDLLERHDIPYQYFANRSDSRGGSTLGNISNNHSSMLSVDVGLAQLAMHSCVETAGNLDNDYMVKAVKAFYSESLIK